MSIRERPWFPIIFMFAVTLLLSAIIIVFGVFTQQRVKDNERIAFERAVLEALAIELPRNVSLREIHTLYQERIRDSLPSTAGALLYMVDDSLVAYVLPLEGPGFWAPIRGVMGIAADKKTVTGISFYEQNETPGLGGEIVKPVFRMQFKGLRLADTGVPVEVRMAGAVVDESSVHAITGATQTSMRLGAFMNEQLARWRAAMNEGD